MTASNPPKIVYNPVITISTVALVQMSNLVTARMTTPPANSVTLIFVSTYPITDTHVKYQRAAGLNRFSRNSGIVYTCLLYTSDAADERSSVDLGGRRI